MTNVIFKDIGDDFGDEDYGGGRRKGGKRTRMPRQSMGGGPRKTRKSRAKPVSIDDDYDQVEPTHFCGLCGKVHFYMNSDDSIYQNILELHPQISANASYQKCSRYPHTKQYKRTNETRNESFSSTATSTTSKNGYSGEFLKCEIEILKIFVIPCI